MNKPIFALLLSGIACGCSVGMEPQGPSPSEIQAKIAAMPPEQQISLIQNSPMPKAVKDQRIQEIRTKFNLPATTGSASTQNPSQPGPS
jgi:hypothetical protein